MYGLWGNSPAQVLKLLVYFSFLFFAVLFISIMKTFYVSPKRKSVQIRKKAWKAAAGLQFSRVPAAAACQQIFLSFRVGKAGRGGFFFRLE